MSSAAPAAPADPGHDLDLEAVFSSANHGAEMEALAVRAVLDAGGIPSVLIGSSQIPSLPFEVRVPRSMLDQAKAALAEAEAAGPEAAEESASWMVEDGSSMR